MITKAFKHPVIDNFRIILGGNIAAQLIGLVSYIFIARLYSTEVIGESALFLSVALIASILQSGQVYWKMFSNHSKEEIEEIYQDSASYLFLTMPILFVLSLALYFSPWNRLGFLVFLIPFFAFSYNLLEINKTYFNSTGELKKTVHQVFLSRSYGQLLKVLLAFVAPSSLSLVASEILANCFIGTKERFFSFKKVWGRTSTNLFGQYKNHIFYYTPVNLSNFLIQELPVILSTYVYGLKESGSFFLINRLIINPMTLVGNSFASSQIKKLNSYNKNLTSKRSFLLKSYGILIVVGAVPAIVLYFFGDRIFLVVFGRAHAETALLVAYIAPVLPFRLIKALTMLSVVNTDLYRETLFIKITLVVSVLCLPVMFAGLNFNTMIILILVIETIADLVLAGIGLLKLGQKYMDSGK